MSKPIVHPQSDEAVRQRLVRTSEEFCRRLALYHMNQLKPGTFRDQLVHQVKANRKQEKADQEAARHNEDDKTILDPDIPIHKNIHPERARKLIIAAVARKYCVPDQHVFSNRRSAPVSEARQEIMFLFSCKLNMSSLDIGQYFHVHSSTVSYSCTRARHRIERDAAQKKRRVKK